MIIFAKSKLNGNALSQTQACEIFSVAMEMIILQKNETMGMILMEMAEIKIEK